MRRDVWLPISGRHLDVFRVLTGDVEVGEGTAVAVGAGEADLGGSEKDMLGGR